MHNKAVSSSVGEAFHRTIDLLFKPFSWKRWGRLVLIAWLAGTLSGGCNLGGSGGGNNASRTRDAKPAVVSTATPGSTVAEDPALRKKVESEHEKKYWFEHGLFKSVREGVSKIPAWYMNVVIWPIVLFTLLLVIAFMMFWIWLSARFQFIWIHAARTGEVQIRRPFRLYEIPADSLATFSCWAALLTVVYYTALIVPPSWAIYLTVKAVPGILQSGIFFFRTLWPWFLLFVFSVAVTLLFFSIVSDFVAPLMASEPILFKEAFGKWLHIYKQNRLAVWRYFGIKAIIFVLGGALTMASAVIVSIVFLLAGALLFGLLYLIFMVLLKLKAVFWVLAVLLGLPFFAAMVFGLSVCALPVSVFFRIFSLTFLDKLTSPAAEV